MHEDWEKAHDLSTQLLMALDATNTEPNMAQTALGTAWVRLCIGMGFDKTKFKEICDGMVELYEKEDES